MNIPRCDLSDDVQDFATQVSLVPCPIFFGLRQRHGGQRTDNLNPEAPLGTGVDLVIPCCPVRSEHLTSNPREKEQRCPCEPPF